jgi:hypothetical protein
MEGKIIQTEDNGSHRLLLISNNNEYPYGSVEFNEFISLIDFKNQNESEESKRQLITNLVASLNNLENYEYFSKKETVTKILNLFLKIDKKLFNINHDALRFIQHILNLYTCLNDLNNDEHEIFLLILKVLIKFSIITGYSIQCFCENGLLKTVSAIVGTTIDYLKTNCSAISFNIYETLNYSLYLLYKFSFITSVYTNNLDNHIVVMIQRTKNILNDYLLDLDYLKSSYYKTELIITCSLLCLFNNLVNKLSTYRFQNIINTEMNENLVKLCDPFLINPIKDPKSFSYKILAENELEIENQEYIKYFCIGDVFISLNRFSIFSSILNSQCHETMIKFNNFIKQSVESHKMETLVNQDSSMIQIDYDYNENIDLSIIEKFEHLMREKQYEQICSDNIVLYFNYLRIKSKSESKALEEKKDFLKIFFSNLIELMNNNYKNNVEGHKTLIEHIIVLIKNILTQSKVLVEIVDYLFIVLLKLILRQIIYSSASIEAVNKNLFDVLFLTIDRIQNFKLFDFEEITGTNNFTLYLSELTRISNVLTYDNKKFYRDLCLYFIVMICGRIPNIFEDRTDFFKVIRNLIEKIFNTECGFEKETIIGNNGYLNLYEIFGYILLVLPSFVREGHAIKIKNWIESLKEDVFNRVNCSLSYKFTVNVLIKFIKKTAENNNGLIVRENESYETSNNLLYELSAFLEKK